MAGLNYSNKNPQSSFTNEDLMRGYSGAVAASLIVAITLRRMTSKVTKNAQGTKLLVLNTLVGSVASACASFCNTSLMRQPEVFQGIRIYKSKSLKETDSYKGKSQYCAQ
jgi:hypothetical protein